MWHSPTHPEHRPPLAPATPGKTSLTTPARQQTQRSPLPTTAPRAGSWSIDDFDFGPKLGEGRFGKIYLARERQSHAAVVIKCISKNAMIRLDMVHQLRREVELQAYVSQSTRRITKLYAYFWDATTVYVVLEHAEGGDLRRVLDRAPRRGAGGGGVLDDHDAALCVADVTEAVAHMHRLGVAHRDIKPENILVRKGRCKVADFTWAVQCGPTQRQRRTTMCGTLDYLSPEMVQSMPYGPEIDVWSLGVLAYELLCGVPPFERPQSDQTCHAIVTGDLAIPACVGDDAADFIRSALAVQPMARPAAGTLLEHAWLRRARAAAGPNGTSPTLVSLVGEQRSRRHSSRQQSATTGAGWGTRHGADGTSGTAATSQPCVPTSASASQPPEEPNVSRALDLTDGGGGEFKSWGVSALGSDEGDLSSKAGGAQSTRAGSSVSPISPPDLSAVTSSLRNGTSVHSTGRNDSTVVVAERSKTMDTDGTRTEAPPSADATLAGASAIAGRSSATGTSMRSSPRRTPIDQPLDEY